jgi:hypothetical protein
MRDCVPCTEKITALANTYLSHLSCCMHRNGLVEMLLAICCLHSFPIMTTLHEDPDAFPRASQVKLAN